MKKETITLKGKYRGAECRTKAIISGNYALLTKSQIKYAKSKCCSGDLDYLEAYDKQGNYLEVDDRASMDTNYDLYLSSKLI